MSLAIAYTVAPPQEANLSWRYFTRALAVALAAVGAGCAIYAVEKYLVAPRHRFMESPAEVMMRAFAMAHFWVGWLFLATSPRLRHPVAAARLAGCILAGVAVCLVFSWAGGSKNPLLMMAFFSVFLVHDVRDQVRLFQRQPDAPAASPERDRLLNAVQLAMTLLVIMVLAGFYLMHALWKGKPLPEGTFTPFVLLGLWAGLAAAAACSAGRLMSLIRNSPGSYAAFAEDFAPLLRILAALLIILFAGSAFGSLGLNFIILLHATTWLVHVHGELSKNRKPSRNPWTWVRCHPIGFVALHLTLVAGVLTLMALRVQLWQRTGWFCTLLAASSYPLWSFMHIATGFWRGK